MISLIFTRKKLLVGISGKVTEFLEVDGSPFIEFGYSSPADTLEQNLNEILNEYRYYLNRNGGDMPAQIDISILYPNDRPAAELAQIQETIRRSDHSLSIVHIDSLVLPYLYGMSHYDEIISAPCIVLEALDNYISLLYFHNPKKVNGSFLPIEENNLPTEYLKEKLSPQRLESMGIRQVFLLGKYLYNDFVLDFLENDLSLGEFIVRKNTSHLTDYKFMIKGSQRRMKDFSINPSERLADWNKTLARIQIPISKKEIKQREEIEQIPPAKDLSNEVSSHEDAFARLSGKIDQWKLEINPQPSVEDSKQDEHQDAHTKSSEDAGYSDRPNKESKSPYSTPAFSPNTSSPQEDHTENPVQKSTSATDIEIEALKNKIDRQTELYDKMAGSFEESAKRAQESMLRVRETEGEIRRLKKIVESKEDEVSNLQAELSSAQELMSQLESKTNESAELKNQLEVSDDLLKKVEEKNQEIESLNEQLNELVGVKESLDTKNEEIEKLKERLETAEKLTEELSSKESESESEELSQQLKITEDLKAQLRSKDAEVEELQNKLTAAEELKVSLEAREIEVFDLQRKLKKITVLEVDLEAREQEIKGLKKRLEQAIEMESELEKRKREIKLMEEEQETLKEKAEYLNRKIIVLEDKIKGHEISLNDKDADLAKLEEIGKLREQDEKENNSLKQELELLLNRYKIQQELLANKDQEFIEYKDARIDADLELKGQISSKEEEIEKLKEEIKNRQFKHNDELKARLAEIDELKSNVDSKEHKIGKLLSEQEKLTNQISTTESDLNDRVLELKALNVRLKVKELEVQELEQGLKSREEEISNLGKEMLAKNKLISTKESGNQKLKGEVNLLKDQILALELNLKKSEGDIKVREEEIAILKKDINQLKVDAENVYRSHEKQKFQLEEKIKSLRGEITANNEKISQLETTIRQKEKEIQEQVNKYKIEKESKQVLSDKLLALNKNHEDLKNLLKEKEEELGRALPELEKSKVRLLDLSSVIEEQRTAEAQYKSQIIEQDKKISVQDKEIAGKISDLNKLKEQYIKSEDQLTQAKQKIDDHSKAIVNLNKDISTKKSKLDELGQKLAESDEEIVELKAKLDLSTSRWADIGLALKGRDEHIIQLEEELLSLREVKKVLSTDIDQANFELNDAKNKVKVYIAERNVAEARANELSLQVKRLESLSTGSKDDNEAISDLQSTIRSLNKELIARDSKIQQFTNELGSKEKEIDQLTKRIDTQRADLIAFKKAGLTKGAGNNTGSLETDELHTRLNSMKAEMQAKDKELKELIISKRELGQKLQKLEESKSAGADQSRFQKMIEGKNEVIRALKIKLGEKDKELRGRTKAQAGRGGDSEDIQVLKEKLKAAQQAQEKMKDDLKNAHAQLEDQKALRNKLLEMEKEMVVQRGRTKSRLEALEAELAKAFEDKISDSNDLNSHNKFQKTV